MLHSGRTKEASDLSCVTLSEEHTKNCYGAHTNPTIQQKERPTPLRTKYIDANLIECYFIDTPIFACGWSSVGCTCIAHKSAQKVRVIFFFFFLFLSVSSCQRFLWTAHFESWPWILAIRLRKNNVVLEAFCLLFWIANTRKWILEEKNFTYSYRWKQK